MPDAIFCRYCGQKREAAVQFDGGEVRHFLRVLVWCNGLDITFKKNVGNHIPNSWVMFDLDIYQPLY